MKNKLTQSNQPQQQAGKMRWLFTLSVFIASLTACTALIFAFYYLFQCGISGSNSSGNWCGAAAIYTIPYWGPLAFVLAVVSSVVAFRSSTSEAAMTLTVGIVMSGLFLVMLS